MKSQILSVLNECDFDVIGDAIHVKHNGKKVGELAKDPTFSTAKMTNMNSVSGVCMNCKKTSCNGKCGVA